MQKRNGKKEIIILALLIFFIDQFIKILVIRFMQPSQTIPLLKNILHITYIQNKGTFFGLFPKLGIVFTIASIAVVLFIIVFVKFLSKKDAFIRLAFGFLLGGAMSNSLDRFRLGYVVDFIDIRVWPVFNFADMAICAAIFLFILVEFRYYKKQKIGSRNASDSI